MKIAQPYAAITLLVKEIAQPYAAITLLVNKLAQLCANITFSGDSVTFLYNP